MHRYHFQAATRKKKTPEYDHFFDEGRGFLVDLMHLFIEPY